MLNVFRRWAGRLFLVCATMLALGVVVFAVGVLWPEPVLTPARTLSPIAIVDVAIVNVEGATLVPAQTVVLEGGRIAAVGAAQDVTVPADALVVNGGGTSLLPAFWDMHTHVYAFAPLLDLPLAIAFGVTNVRDMQGCPQAGDPFIACAEDKRRWTEEALAGARVTPRIVASTSFMANGPGMRERLGNVPAYFDTSTAEEARQFVRHFAGQVDAIKVYDNLPREAYLALIDEARLLGLDVVGHRPHAVSALEAAARQKSLEHARFLLHESFAGSAALRAQAGTAAWREDRQRMLDEHDPAMAAAIFTAMAREGTWYAPTHLTRWADAYAEEDAVRKDARLRYLHPLLQWAWREDVDALLARDPSPEARETYRAFYRKGLALTGAAQDAGVRVLVGTDYLVSGPDVHRELEQLVLAGLTPAEALRAATLSPAEYFELDTQFGRVEAGYTADLVLLDANPLDDIRHTTRIRAVVFDGALYDRKALDAIDAHVRAQARSWTVAAKILWRFVRNPVDY
jgi:imidazolonepropionase-like amidohydrolase